MKKKNNFIALLSPVVLAAAVACSFSPGCSKKHKSIESHTPKAVMPATAAKDPDKCTNCHVKEKPVHGDSKLRGCPVDPEHSRNKKKITETSNEPSVVIIDNLVDKYDPVRFTHKKHADMAQMGGGCWSCHHNSPADKPHPACKTCHKVDIDRNNPQVPRLKAAYHRHCMDCHRKWSGGNDCKVCHAERGKGPKITLDKGLGNPYPKLKEPKKLVYETKYKKSVVTFFHNDHTQLFKIQCEYCHSKASCSECHNRKKGKPATKPNHKTCSGCHDTNLKSNCSKCHRGKPMESYTHNSTGFPLNTFHKKLKCSSCHHQHNYMQKLSPDCRTCHKGDSFKDFDHSVTGFNLKPYHTGMQCVKCHPPNRPLRPESSNCSFCHKGKVPSSFRHSTTGYTLAGPHAKAPCASCHTDKNSMRVKGTGCDDCHTVANLKTFDHSKTGFKLGAQHSGLKCGQCHTSRFSMQPRGKTCTDCHKSLSFKDFDHSSTGFPLKAYHAKQACDSCHRPSGGEFISPDQKCTSCHKNAFKDLDHGKAVGVPLDEMHGSLGCPDCHTKGFSAPPDCSGCHGDDKSYPKDKPGK